MDYDTWKTTPPERPRRRGDSLYCYCDACGNDEVLSIRELRYEPGGTGYQTCEFCDMELCYRCYTEGMCYEEKGKKYTHEGEEISPEEE